MQIVSFEDNLYELSKPCQKKNIVNLSSKEFLVLRDGGMLKKETK